MPERRAVTAYAATTSPSLDTLKSRLRRLNLYGLMAHAEELLPEPWLERVLGKLRRVRAFCPGLIGLAICISTSLKYANWG
jgi:hypothetical protein